MTTPDAVATDALEDLRAAMAALPSADDRDDAPEGDASADAERFEAVHEALVAVLADVDRT
jgi:hypothetical protein